MIKEQLTEIIVVIQRWGRVRHASCCYNAVVFFIAFYKEYVSFYVFIPLRHCPKGWSGVTSHQGCLNCLGAYTCIYTDICMHAHNMRTRKTRKTKLKSLLLMKNKKGRQWTDYREVYRDNLNVGQPGHDIHG